MPVRNEGRHIARTLGQLLAQDYPGDRFEILVVDGDSTDDTRAIVQGIIDRESEVRSQRSEVRGQRSTDEPGTTNQAPGTTNQAPGTKHQAPGTKHGPRISLLHNPKRLSSAARNIGVRHARGEAVLIVDGHCEIPNRSMLSNLAAAFQESGVRDQRSEIRDQRSEVGESEIGNLKSKIQNQSNRRPPLPNPPHPRGGNLSVNHEQRTKNKEPRTKNHEQRTVSCVGRPQPLDVTGATTLQRAVAAARSSRLGHHPDSFIYADQPQLVPAGSVAVAYRREVFRVVGEFDERFDACEDYEFNTRVDKAGLACYFEPGIAVYYHPRDSLRGLFRQLVRYGRGRVRMMRKHPDTFNPKTLAPAVFVLGLVLGWLPGLFVPWLLAAYFAVVMLYFLIVVAVSLAIAASQRDLRLFPYLVPVFATIHLAAGTGLLVEVVRGS